MDTLYMYNNVIVGGPKSITTFVCAAGSTRSDERPKLGRVSYASGFGSPLHV